MVGIKNLDRNSTIMAVKHGFSALRCSRISIYAALRCSKIHVFQLILANSYLGFKKILIGCIKGYQYVLSPLLLPSCRYLPTCSSYAMEAITSHGVSRGLYYAVRRVMRCHPWGGHGFDPVPPFPVSSKIPGAPLKTLLSGNPDGASRSSNPHVLLCTLRFSDQDPPRHHSLESGFLEVPQNINKG